MKTYIKPKVTLINLDTRTVLLQDSMPVGDTPVDGENALARPFGGFYDFGDEESDYE